MNKIKYSLLIFILILFLLIFIFFNINKYIFQKKEHYLTYFLPYYEKDLSLIANFYLDNDNNKNFIKTKINYDVIKIGTSKLEEDFSILLFNYYISNSNTYRSENIIYKIKIKQIEDLANKKINFCISNISVIYFYQTYNPNIFNELRLISKLFKIYFYFFTKKQYNVFTLDDIPTNFKICISKDTYELYFYKIFFNNLNYKEDIDYKIILFENYNEMFSGFIENKIQMIFMTLPFPNKLIEQFLDKNVFDNIILLPFNIRNETLFLKKLPFIKTETIDLNNLSKSYLPKKFNDNEYSIFKPDLKVCYCYNIFFTNKKISDDDTYNFIKFIFENYKLINSNLPTTEFYIHGNEIDNTDLNMIKYHPGVVKYFYEKGIFTNESDPNCKYLYGVKACTKESLENNIFPNY